MADHSATLTSKGQITLPAKLRQELGLQTGDQITFVEEDKGYRLVPRVCRFKDLRGIVKSGKRIRAADIDRWIEEARAVSFETKRR